MAHRLDYKMKLMLGTALFGCFVISTLASANIHTMREIRATSHDIFTPATVIKMSLKQLTETRI